MLGNDVTGPRGSLLWFFFGLGCERGGLFGACKRRCGNLAPDGLYDRPHVLLKRGRAGGFDLIDRSPVGLALGPGENRWKTDRKRVPSERDSKSWRTKRRVGREANRICRGTHDRVLRILGCRDAADRKKCDQ